MGGTADLSVPLLCWISTGQWGGFLFFCRANYGIDYVLDFGRVFLKGRAKDYG